MRRRSCGNGTFPATWLLCKSSRSARCQERSSQVVGYQDVGSFSSQRYRCLSFSSPSYFPQYTSVRACVSQLYMKSKCLYFCIIFRFLSPCLCVCTCVWMCHWEWMQFYSKYKSSRGVIYIWRKHEKQREGCHRYRPNTNTR